MNKEKHKYFMSSILLDIFKDKELSAIMAFKGGTSLMFLHELPRFSVDLDFNILDVSEKNMVYGKVREIALKYGTIADEQMKYFGPVIVLDYGKGERKLKLELSTRCFDNHYELVQFSGNTIQCMVKPDMFAHKLCALLDRGGNITGRDVFDINFFLRRGEALHRGIVEQRMKMSLENYIDECVSVLQKANLKELMANVGELLTEEYKQQMRSGRLVDETISLLKAFRAFPVIEDYPLSRMPVSNVAIKNNPQGEAVLIAYADNEYYTGKILSSREKTMLNAYPGEEDKKNFLISLARTAYYNEWEKKQGKNKTLKI